MSARLKFQKGESNAIIFQVKPFNKSQKLPQKNSNKSASQSVTLSISCPSNCNFSSYPLRFFQAFGACCNFLCKPLHRTEFLPFLFWLVNFNMFLSTQLKSHLFQVTFCNSRSDLGPHLLLFQPAVHNLSVK